MQQNQTRMDAVLTPQTQISPETRCVGSGEATMRVVTLLSTAAGAVDDATPVTAVTVLGPPSLEAPGLAGDAFRFLGTKS